MTKIDLTIKELLQAADVPAGWTSSEETPVTQLTGVCIDSRTIRTGELFVAIKGDRFDGHDFVQPALEKGAAAAVVSERWFKENRPQGDLPFMTVPDTLVALQQYARYYRLKFQVPVVAITGSSGKTTSKELLSAVLGQKLKVLKSEKSFNNHIGVPLTLFRLRPEHDVLVSELGTSNFGELERLSYLIRPDICVILNIGHAHLEFLHDLDGVARAKAEIFAYADQNGTAVLNADDPILGKMNVPVRHVQYFGLEDGDVQAENVVCGRAAQYDFCVNGVKISLNIPGRHNVYNALAAATVGRLFDIPGRLIKTGLESVRDIDKRMQVYTRAGITVISDVYNSNFDSCRAGIMTLNDMNTGKGRNVAVLSDMLEIGKKSEKLHRELGLFAAENHVDALFTCGHEIRYTAKSARGKIKQSAFFENKQNLLSALEEFIHPGDVLLVKGSRGMRMETIVDDILKYLSDKEA